MLSDTEIASYAAGLYARRADAVFAPRIDVPAAVRGKCHANVEAYVAANPGTERVTGWLIMKIANGPNWFLSHSVVKTIDGRLIDISPSGDERLRLPFLMDCSATFFALIEQHRPQLECWSQE